MAWGFGMRGDIQSGQRGLGVSNGLNAFCAGDVYSIFIPFRSEEANQRGIMENKAMINWVLPWNEIDESMGRQCVLFHI